MAAPVEGSFSRFRLSKENECPISSSQFTSPSRSRQDLPTASPDLLFVNNTAETLTHRDKSTRRELNSFVQKKKLLTRKRAQNREYQALSSTSDPPVASFQDTIRAERGLPILLSTRKVDSENDVACDFGTFTLLDETALNLDGKGDWTSESYDLSHNRLLSEGKHIGPQRLRIRGDDRIRTGHATTALERKLLASRSRSTISRGLSSPSNRIDPLDCTAVPFDRHMQVLLNFYAKVIIPRIFPIRIQAEASNSWAIPSCFAQPALLHAILSMTSADFEALNGSLSRANLVHRHGDVKGPYPDHLRFKLKAIRSLNEKLANPKQAVEVSTIYAIMCLMSVENVCGNEADIHAHTAGLQRLLALKGGLAGYPLAVILPVISTAYMCAAITRTPPPFAPPALTSFTVSEATRGMISSCPERDLQSMAQGFFAPEPRACLNNKFLHIVSALRDACLFRELHIGKPYSPSLQELEHYQIKGRHIDYQLLSLPFAASLTAIEETCRIALFVFVNANFMVYEPSSALYRALVAQLKEALDRSFAIMPRQQQKTSLWQSVPEFLMWVLFLGAHVSGGEVERPWFIMRLAKGKRLLRIEESQEMTELLRRFFYLDRVYGTSLKRIWQEVQLVAEVQPATDVWQPTSDSV